MTGHISPMTGRTFKKRCLYKHFWLQIHSMAKENECRLAKIMYVDQLKDAKEISTILKVSEATLSKWVNKFGWKEQRNAKLSSPEVRTDNIKQVINGLTEDRINLDRQLKDAERRSATDKAATIEVVLIRKNIAQVDDSISKWNKTLFNVEKEQKISFSSYMYAMEQIFNALHQYNEKIFLQTIDFQEDHLNDVARRYR